MRIENHPMTADEQARLKRLLTSPDMRLLMVAIESEVILCSKEVSETASKACGKTLERTLPPDFWMAAQRMSNLEAFKKTVEEMSDVSYSFIRTTVKPE
jgi:hypothetical protein